MTTHMTKTWFDGENITTQEIPEAEIYEREWVGLTDEEVVNRANAEVFAEAFARGVAWAELKLKEKNT